jgi:hypothetical protein
MTMRREPHYVLVWTVDGQYRGAFCPTGGMARGEAEDAEGRLRERARAAGWALDTALVPYVFDVDVDEIPGMAPDGAA